MSYVSSHLHCVFITKERRPIITPALRERLRPLFSRRPTLIFLVEAGVAGFEAYIFSGDPHSLHAGALVEDVAVGGDERRFFADFQGAKAVGDTGDLRGI